RRLTAASTRIFVIYEKRLASTAMERSALRVSADSVTCLRSLVKRRTNRDKMRSLFLKIFLWFWMTVVLVGLSLVGTTVITSTKSATDAEGWKASVAFAVSGEANRSVSIYETDGAATLKKHFEQMRKARFVNSYLLDEHGNEVLGQRPPQQAVRLAL